MKSFTANMGLVFSGLRATVITLQSHPVCVLSRFGASTRYSVLISICNSSFLFVFLTARIRRFPQGNLLQRSWSGKWSVKEISTSLTETMPQSTSSVWYALKTEKHWVTLKRENGGSEA